MKSTIRLITTENKILQLKNYSDIDIAKTRVFAISHDTYYSIQSEVFDYPNASGEIIVSMPVGYIALQEIWVCDILLEAQYVYNSIIFENKIFEDLNGCFSSLILSPNFSAIRFWINGFLEGMNIVA